MKTKKIKTILRRTSVLTLALLFAGVGLYHLPLVHADPPATVGAPAQEMCEAGGSTNVRWDNLNHGAAVVRPTISALSIKASPSDPDEVITGFEDPDVGDIGATICPNVALGRRSGLNIYTNTVNGGDSYLTNAETPAGHPITANSEITITIDSGDFGDLAEYYSFSLIHGHVVDWLADGLGTEDAMLSVTLKPVRTPFGNGEQFGFCTATPPMCNAVKSDADALAASLDMTFTTSGDEGQPNEHYDVNGHYSEMRGSFFAVTGAMGGWAQAVGPGGQPRSVRATLGGPHLLATASQQSINDPENPLPQDLNTGSLQAFMPDDVIESVFETTAEDLTADSLSVIKSEDGAEDEDSEFGFAQVPGGIMITVDGFHFSSPAFNIGLAGFNSGGGGDGEGGGDSDNSKLINLSGGAKASLETANGTVINSFTASQESGLGAQDAGYSYPLGLLNFVVGSVPNGSTQTINLAFLTDLKPNQVVLRKYDANAKTYATITEATITEDTFDGQHVLNISYSITDNGKYDQDTVLGQITDPVGLGMVAAGVPNTGFRR